MIGPLLLAGALEAGGAAVAPNGQVRGMEDEIGPADPRHRCYREGLGRQDSPGQNHLLLADWRAICKCLGRPAAD